MIEHLEQLIQVALLGVKLQHAGAKDCVDTGEQTACQHHRNQGGHAACHIADDLLAHLFGCQLFLFLYVFIGGRGLSGGVKAAQLQNLVIDLGNGGANDDLILTAAAGNAQNTVDLFYFFILRNSEVLQHESQTGHAVGYALHVGGAANCVQYAPGCFLIVCHVAFLLFVLFFFHGWKDHLFPFDWDA